MQPERPSVATHAGTVAPGWIEIEAGAVFAHSGGESIGSGVPMVAKIGVTPRMQLTIGGSIVAPRDGEAGAGDLVTALKWRFAETRAIGRLAIQPSIKFPTGSQDHGTGVDTTDGSLLLIASRPLGPLSLDVNVGYTHRSGDGTAAPVNASIWAISFGGPAYRRLGWGAEMSGVFRTSGPSGGPAVNTLLLGPTLSVTDWLAFDAGASVDFYNDQSFRIYFGGVWNIGKIWP